MMIKVWNDLLLNHLAGPIFHPMYFVLSLGIEYNISLSGNITLGQGGDGKGE